MNVVRIVTTVSKCVQIHLDLTCATATLAIGWPQTGLLVMVSKVIGFVYDIIIILKPHIDINECTERTHACAQVCTNTVGSYTCSCGSGYRLASNGLGCNG